MYKLGLTGSIGMGKSTTLGFFADLGCPVWNADVAVHRLYDHKGAAVEPIRTIAPSAIVNGVVDRNQLKNLLHSKQITLVDLETIVHPLVTADRIDFAAEHSEDIVVFDVPLLFETADPDWFDAVVVVSAPPDIQKQRVMARPDMTEEQFKLILSRQMPDKEKQSKADFTMTTVSLTETQNQVAALVKKIQKEQSLA